MREPLRDVLAGQLGAAVRDVTPLSGGDINEAYAAELADGRRVFVKTNRRADPRMFGCEARGLAWLAEPQALRVPAVLAVGGEDGGPCFLVLELIERGRRRADFDERFASGLAALHDAGAEHFGLWEDNFIAVLPQDNQVTDDWATFYGERRLLPQVRRAIDTGTAPSSWGSVFDTLCARLPGLVGDPEPPARLHGDLWSGNVHTDEAGAPCLIDPAVYGGHREVDLAMLALFGGVGGRFMAAYHEASPLQAGWRDRVDLYQLYPLLVHVNLFGGGYVSSVERALGPYL